MKCCNCPALVCEGYEYPEEYCSIQVEDEVREFADGEYGCLLRRSTIEKRVAENEAAFSKYCEDMSKWYVQTEDIEERPETLADCVDILRAIRKDGKVKIDSKSKACTKLVYCGFVVDEGIFDTDLDSFAITEAGEQWLDKYADFDLFDVEFVICGSIEYEDSDIGQRIECNGTVALPEGGFALKDGRAWHRVLAKTPQEALSIAEKLLDEEDFKSLSVNEIKLEHIYQESQEKYYYSEDL